MRLAPQLDLPALHRLGGLAQGEDHGRVGRHEDGELGVPRPDGRYALGRAHLALEAGVVLQGDRVDVQRVIAWKREGKYCWLILSLLHHLFLLDRS